MAQENIRIKTADGECRAFVAKPAGAKPGDSFPGILFYMDGLAIRPALFSMIQELADKGYVVLLPDMFYRYGPYDPVDPKVAFGSGNVRAYMGHLFASTNPTLAVQDAKYFIDYLLGRDDVSGDKIGTTGYCMGGGWSLNTAGAYADKVAAAASFHGGGLATDDAMSPHLQAPNIKAKVLVAGADEDGSYPPEMETRLNVAFDEAGTDYESSIWPGMLHGWTMSDFPEGVANAEGRERHFKALEKLYGETLKG